MIVVTGSQVTVELDPRSRSKEKATVGQFMGLMSGTILIVGMVTEVGELAVLPAAAGLPLRKVARLDLLGEVRSGPDGQARFQRGITEYPGLGDTAVLLGERELQVVYGKADTDHAHIGNLQQNSQIGVHIDIDDLVSRHFAILGATGVGKSSGVAIILQKILDARPNLRIFLVDPHNEYGRCFGDKAQVLTPRNLRLPFWLFNFEEIVDAFFGGRPGVDEEVEILSEVIPLAKSAYLQYRVNNDHPLAKKRNARDTGFTADTPVPYRIEDHQPARRAHGQVGEPLLAHCLSQVDRAHRDLPQSSALRLHVRKRQYRRRHHGRDHCPPVPAADRRQADDHHAARRLSGRGGRTRWCRCSAAWRSISDCGATA